MAKKYSQKEMENAVMLAADLWQRSYNAKSTEGYGTLEVVMTIISEACNMERWITENYGEDDDCYLDRVEEYEKILEEKYDLPKAKNQDLYDSICKVLTWYEHRDECPVDNDELYSIMYDVLTRVQNTMFNN